MTISSILILLIIGIAAGMLSGFVGVGGGIVIVPALVFFLGFTQHQAQGTSLAMMIPPIGLLAVWNYYKAGQVNMAAAAVLCLTFFVGAFFGSKLSIAMDPAKVKRIFAVVMMAASLKLMFGK
ncbi:MAG: sulfite exporter TauE/SafE family protein [Flavobacteriales bacterium]|nr:sulfite exporter TauE/SafE family protein [Flavobacteriales bacterium]